MIGLKLSKKIKVFNGKLECRFLRFDIYKGSKKQSKYNCNKKESVILSFLLFI